jgi:hypothetical protein
MHASQTHALKAKIDYQFDSISSTFKEKKFAPNNNNLSFFKNLFTHVIYHFLRRSIRPIVK